MSNNTLIFRVELFCAHARSTIFRQRNDNCLPTHMHLTCTFLYCLFVGSNLNALSNKRFERENVLIIAQFSVLRFFALFRFRCVFFSLHSPHHVLWPRMGCVQSRFASRLPHLCPVSNANNANYESSQIYFVCALAAFKLHSRRHACARPLGKGI